MDKKEEFKRFASLHPELISHIKNGNMSWQKFYEIYDIYGDNNEAWREYFTTGSTNNTSSDLGLNQITKMVKNIDVDSIQKHINTAQKALGFISELTSKNPTSNLTSSGPLNPRPLNKFFED